MTGERASTARRLLAFGADWLVVFLWGSLLFGAVMLATGGDPPRPASPWTAQAIGFLTMPVPVTLYFALCESSAMQASLGKRALGLVVVRENRERLTFGSALFRNAVKFVPWEFGHTLAQQSAYSGEEALPTWLFGVAFVALAGPLWWLVTMIASGRTPYDRWASAWVVPRYGVAHQPKLSL